LYSTEVISFSTEEASYSTEEGGGAWGGGITPAVSAEEGNGAPSFGAAVEGSPAVFIEEGGSAWGFGAGTGGVGEDAQLGASRPAVSNEEGGSAWGFGASRAVNSNAADEATRLDSAPSPAVSILEVGGSARGSGAGVAVGGDTVGGHSLLISEVVNAHLEGKKLVQYKVR